MSNADLAMGRALQMGQQTDQAQQKIEALSQEIRKLRDYIQQLELQIKKGKK